MNYDPNSAPDPKKWLQLDETRRQTLVREAHEQDPMDFDPDTVNELLKVKKNYK